ncbi:tetratricopeptide repeat protein [Meiothermus granaticius]|nr:tetratricopeptide repeat protein [Meiothermus granaticius]GEM87119.1 abortive infection protein [Meiothermus granaticius NBRC 107808]
MVALRAVLFAVGIALIGITAAAPMGADGYYAQCRALYEQRVLDSAQATCELALTADPNHLPSQKLLARIWLERGQVAQAQPYLDRIVQAAPEDPEVRYLEAKADLLQGRPAEALKILPPILSTEVILAQAEAYEALGRYEEALETYRKAPSSVEARLGAARLAEKLGRPAEALSWLGDSPAEQLAEARLMWLSGQTEAAAKTLEAVLPKLGPLEPDYTKTLGLLAVIYYGQGQAEKGALVLRQLSSRVSLPSALLAKIWPWLVVLLVFLALVLFGESRIEPMRTVEMSAERQFGPGSLYLWLIASLLLSGILVTLLGHTLYANILAAFTPVQADVIRPVFYLLYGALALLIAWRSVGPKGLAASLGPRSTWVEGSWAGLVLLVLLVLYGYIAKPLGLSTLDALYPVFFGLALLEVVIRGLGYSFLRERYRELASFMVPLLFALAIPGPTLYFLLVSIFLGWLFRRTRGALAGAVAWVVAGIILALVGNLPLMRTLL